MRGVLERPKNLGFDSILCVQDIHTKKTERLPVNLGGLIDSVHCENAMYSIYSI